MKVNERHKQLTRLKAALLALYVLSESQQTKTQNTTLEAVLELKKEQQKPKSGMEEMIEMLGLQGCLVPGPKEEYIEISPLGFRLFQVRTDEAVRQCEQAMQESVAYLIRKGPKL